MRRRKGEPGLANASKNDYNYNVLNAVTAYLKTFTKKLKEKGHIYWLLQQQ